MSVTLGSDVRGQGQCCRSDSRTGYACRMTWIKTISPREDPGVRAAAMAARNVFPASYTQSEPGGSVPPSVMADSIVLSHSLIPDVMHYMFTGIGLMMSDDLPLSRREHELIATTTSAINACFY